jgi:hypothetical protein
MTKITPHKTNWKQNYKGQFPNNLKLKNKNDKKNLNKKDWFVEGWFFFKTIQLKKDKKWTELI